MLISIWRCFSTGGVGPLADTRSSQSGLHDLARKMTGISAHFPLNEDYLLANHPGYHIFRKAAIPYDDDIGSTTQHPGGRRLTAP
jgi:hypothetical protein